MAGQEKFDEQFEQEWRRAFEDMQETPPPTIWNEIDRHLTYKELALYKSKATYYKWSAAAVIFLVAFGGLMVMLSNDFFGTDGRVAQYINVDRPTELGQNYNIRIPEKTLEEQIAAGQEIQQQHIPPVATNNNDEEEGSSSTAPASDVLVPPAFDRNQFNEFVLEKIKPESMVAANYEDREIFKIATYDFQAQNRNKQTKDEKFWAGVGMGHGSFDPNFQAAESTFPSANERGFANFSQTNNEALDRNGPDVREGMNAGQTVALGLNFGLKVSSRWTVESGFQYTRSDATTTTNVVIETNSIREVIPASSEVKSVPKVQSAMRQEAVIEYDYQDVNLANEFQFATIPVKAGYLVLDNKFTVEINAGVAANVYLGNKLIAPDDQLASVTFGPGGASPYRELSFSGLAGIQFGYEFYNRFDLVVEPNYRRSINSLTKDNSSFTASPSGFGVMTGIRYRFN